MIDCLGSPWLACTWFWYDENGTEGPSICTLFAFLLLFYVNSGHVRNPGSKSRDDLTHAFSSVFAPGRCAVLQYMFLELYCFWVLYSFSDVHVFVLSFTLACDRGPQLKSSGSEFNDPFLKSVLQQSCPWGTKLVLLGKTVDHPLEFSDSNMHCTINLLFICVR